MSNPVQQYFAALNSNPDNPEAVAGLKQALADAEAWSDITLTIPRFARGLSDYPSRALFLFASSHAARHMTHNEELADSLLEEALGQGLSPHDTAMALRSAFEPAADWRAFTQAAMDVVDRAENDPLSARLFNQMGRVYEDKLYERERAITCYQRAFKLDPKFTEPLRAARAIYAHADQWSTVAKLYQIELRVTEDPREQGRLLKELGYVELERLGDRDRAAETLRQAALIDPDLSGVAATLTSLDSDEEAHGVIVSPRIEQTASVAVDDTADAARAQAADEAAAAEQAAEEAAAAEQAAEEAAAAEQAAEEAAAAEQAAEEAAAAEQAAEEAAAEEAELAAQLAAEEAAAEEAELAAELAAEEAAAEEAELAAELAAEEAAAEAAAADEEVADEEAADEEEAAEVAADSDDAEAAVSSESAEEETAVEAAVEEESADAGADEAAADASVDSSDDDAESDSSSMSGSSASSRVRGPSGASSSVGGQRFDSMNAAAVVTPVAVKETVVRPVAGADEYLDTLVLEAGEMEDEAASLAAWAWALELGARIARDADELAGWVVEAVQERTDSLAALRAVLPPLVGRPDVWTLVCEQLTEFEEAGGGDVAGALYGATFYGLGDRNGAAAYAPLAGPIAQADGAALEVAAKGNWRKAHGELMGAMGVSGPEGELDAYFAQAFLALGMGKEDKAVDSLRRVLRKRKKDVDALFFIKALYRRDESWGPLAEVINAEASQLPGDDTFRLSVAYRDQIEIFRDHLQAKNKMLGAYASLLEIDATDLETIDEYAALLDEMNRSQDLVQVLRMKADAVSDTAEKVAIHAEVAQLYLDRFNNQPEAITSYEQILELDGEHEAALTALEDLYGRRRLWEQLIDVKKRLAGMAATDEERASKLRDCAEIAATRMREPELAITLWNDVLEIDAEDAIALEALERLYERDKNWSALADVLSKRVYVIEDEQERGLALMKLGQIQSDRLNNTEASVQTYEDLLAIDPENFRAKDSLKKAYIELERWDALENFFERSEAWPDYVRQLESLAGTVSNPATQVDLLFRAADVWTNHLGDEGRSTKALERVLSIDETNYDAAVRLAPVYEERGDFKRLPPLLEVILERDEDPERRFEYQVKVARIAQERQRDPERAFTWFGTALDELPHRVEILDSLETAASESGRWEEMRQHLTDARARLAGDEEQRDNWLALTLRLGKVSDGPLDDPDAALTCFDEVLEVLPGDRVALDAKDAIFSRQENWDALLDVIESKVQQATSDDERVSLWQRMCLIQEEHRDDVDSAILGYQEILSIDPANQASLTALRRLYGVTGDAAALSDVLRTLSELHGEQGDANEQKELRLELARTYIDDLAEPSAAAEVLETVVSADPRDLEARGLLERLLAEDGERLRVAKILEPLYEADGDWPKLVDDLEIQLDASTDRETSRGLLGRIGEIQRTRLSDSDLATDAYARLLRIAPEDAEAQANIEAIAHTTGNWESVTELYESLMLELDPSDPEQRELSVDLGTRAATFFDERMSDLSEAVRLHRRVLETDPTRESTMQTLDRLYTRGEQWHELLGVIEMRLNHVESDADRRALHFQAAEIWKVKLESPNEAIDEYRRVLDMFPSDLTALAALDDLYGATADSASRAEIIEQRVLIAEEGSAEQLELQNRLAVVYEDELGEVPRAMELWKGVLAADPTNPMALRGLEAQLESEDYAISASEVLEPLYVAQNEPRGLARLLEIRLLHVDAPDRRKSLYHRIASLHGEDLGDLETSYGVLSRAAQEFLHEDDVIDRLAGLASDIGNHAELGDTLESLANEHGDPTVTRKTLVRVAKLREDKVGDVEAAAELWRQVLDENPGDREALDALQRLDEQLETWGELVDILLRKAELPDVSRDHAQMKPLMFRAAQIHEVQLERPDEAIEVLRTILMHDPTDSDAINELERLFTRTFRWEDLVDNYQRKLDLATTDDERRGLYATLGSVLETELEEPDRAILAYRSILDLDPNDLGALQALDRLFVATEAWYELLEVLRKEVDLVESDDQRRNILFRIGRLHETELMDFTNAVDVYRSILAEDAGHESTRAALQAMVERGDEALGAARILEPIFRTEGRWAELVAINHTLIDYAETAEARRDIHVDIARIMERELVDASGAINALSAATREVPRVAEFDELERLAPVTDAWESICELFVELWDEVVDPLLRTDLGARVARIREEELGDTTGAIASFARLYDEDPSSAHALRALDRLYVRTGDAEALADVLQKRLFAAAPDDDATALRLRLGRVYAESLGEPIEAVTAYREVLQTEPTNTDATNALEAMIQQGVESFEIASILDPLYRSQEAWPKLVALNQTRILAESSPDERYRIWMDSADVYERQLNDKSEALNALGNALFEAPGDIDLKDRIEVLGGEIDLWPMVADVYDMMLGQELGDTEHLDVALRLARIREDELGEVSEAESAYRSALDVEPNNVVALKALDRILTNEERWGEVVGILARLRDAVFDQNELVALAFRHASIQRDSLYEPDASIDTFHEVLEIDPSHRPSLDALIALYTQQENWDALFDVFERISMMTSDEEERTAVTIQMAQLASDRLDRPQDAIDLWRNVQLADPNDRRALNQLALLYERTEQFNELADVIDRQIALETDPETTVALLRQSGRMWAEVLDNPDQAIGRFQQVLTLLPGDANALVWLRTLYEGVGDYERLVATLSELLSIGAVPEAEQTDVYRQLGTIYTDTLMQPAPAINAWVNVLERDPSDEESLNRLEQLYGQDNQWANAVAIVERKIALAEDEEERIELLKHAANVSMHQLNDLDAAAGAYERILELDLGDFDATTMLEDIYTRTERWGDLATLCVDRLDVVEDPWDRVQLLRRAASIYEGELAQPDAAFLIISTAAQEHPADEELRGELERLAGLSGKEEDLVQTYRQMVAQLKAQDADPAEMMPLLMSTGRVLDVQLGRSNEAETAFEDVLAVDSEYEPALAALEDIYTRNESWASLVGVLRRRVNLAFDPHDQVQLHRQIGQLFEERLDDGVEAVEAYKMVIRLDDRDSGALDALERIYEREGQWRDLVEVLERKAENTYEQDEQVALHFRMGEIWQQQLGVAERAVGSYRNVLDHDPTHRESLNALEALYAGLDKWDRFLEIVDAQLGFATSDDERIALHSKQALVYEQHFDDVDAAVGAYLNILAIAPKDIEAIVSLERIFREQDRVAELVDTYERHVAATDDVSEQSEVLITMAQVQVELMDDAHSAISTYTRVLENDPNHVDALTRIGALYEHVEHPEYAVQAYERLATVSEDPAVQLNNWLRAAQLLRDPIGDDAGAEERYRKCLGVNEEYVPAMEALEAIYRDRGDTDASLDMLQRQIEFAATLPQRSALMVRQAHIFDTQLGDAERAALLYEEAIELDPSNTAAAGPLSDIFFAREDWVRAKPLYELQLRSVDAAPDDRALELFFRSGVVSENLGFYPDATQYYEQTLEVEPGHLGALRGLARLYTQLGRADAAYQTYVDILAEHRAHMDASEAVECYFQAGAIKAQQDDAGTARQMFMNALEIDDHHEPSLRSLLTIVEDSGDRRSTVDIKQRLLPTVGDRLERFKLLVELGDALQELGEVTQAEAMFREAVALDPESKVVLHKLLNIFTDTGNWRRATEVLGQLARMEENPERLAKLCFTIAAIFRDELGEADQAVVFFNQALDAKFDYLEAFEAIDHLLTSQRDWQALEENYRRMLTRVEASGVHAETVDLKVQLLKNLGEIYRSRLQQPAAAVDAYRVASQYAPEDEVLLTILVELVERGGGAPEEIILLHQRLIKVSPLRLESYRALFNNYLRARKFDEAWCMAAALSRLDTNATPEEEAFYKENLPAQVLSTSRELSRGMWQEHLYHRELDPNITSIFEVLSVHLRSLLRRDVKDWGVHKRKDKIDLGEEMPLTKMVSYIMTRVGVNDLMLYEKSDFAGLQNMNTDPAALLVGRDMLSDKTPRELAFRIGKVLTLMRPEFYLASAFPSTDHLKTFFLAAMSAITQQVPEGGNTQQIAEFAHEISALPAPVLEQIRRARNNIGASGRNPDLSAWLSHVELVSNRVGLLLCGDLQVAIGCLSQAVDNNRFISKTPATQQAKDLIVFSISDSYFALRRELGLVLKAK